MSSLKTWGLRFAAIGAGLLCTELVLSAAGLISPRIAYQLSPPWNRVLLRDAKLGYRMSPYFPGNDALGYRNLAVPERCEILAVGQSSTYGFAAQPHEAWPRQLEALTGKTVYNMSCGGYGPCESSVLLERGLAFRPQTVLFEIYPNNDLVDAYQAVYPQHRFAELACDDERRLAEMVEADAAQPFPKTKPTLDEPVAANSAREWIALHSSLYGLGRELAQLYGMTQNQSRLSGKFVAERDSFAAGQAHARFLPFAPNLEQRTVFLPPEWYCLRCELSDPRIREGMRITQSVLQSLHDTLTAENIRFVVVNIPTKMSAYKDLAGSSTPRLPDLFFRGVDLEEHATADLREFCEAHQIEWFDGTAVLREQLALGKRLFPEGDDQHLNGSGYGVLADAIAGYLELSVADPHDTERPTDGY